MKKIKICRAPEYRKWFVGQDPRSQLQIEKRLSNIETEEHFGVTNFVGDFVSELKWKNGRRIYYAYIAEKNILLLLGGNKNGQDKDIAQAKRLIRKYSDSED